MTEIPRKIILGGYTYTYKDKLIINFHSFRCKYWTSCKVSIEIDINNIIKINNKENLVSIEYYITSSEKDHKCQNINTIKTDKSTEEINEIKNKKI